MMNTISRNQTSILDATKFDPQGVFDAGMHRHHIANTAYPINHVKTMRDYRVKNSLKDVFTQTAWDGIDSLGLYAHIPFCEYRCKFCEYTVLDPKRHHHEDDHSRYMSGLKKEIDIYASRTTLGGKRIRGFDIGGGTPSAIDAYHIGDLMDHVGSVFYLPQDTNISIETTPKIAAMEPDKMQAYHNMGINRISMGVQTISPKLLERVGRSNTSVDRNKDATENIRKAGFNSYNIDIMYGLLGQGMDSVEATLRHVFALDPEHVTIYRTRYKGTNLDEKGYKIDLVDIQQQGYLIKQMLDEAGYKALTGKNTYSRVPDSSGASTYLTERVVNGTPYVGLGLGAQSVSPKILSYNQGAGSKEIENYMSYVEKGEFPIQDIYHLSPEMSAGKFAAVSFYFGGIHLPSFEMNYRCLLTEMFADEVDFVLKNGYMSYEGDRLQLTKKGVDHYSGVISLFYAGSVKEYLITKSRDE